MTREQIEAEIADLKAKNEEATSWGAAVGARCERIKGLEQALSAMDLQPCSADIAYEMTVANLRRRSEAVYLACEESVAKDISGALKWSADEIDRLSAATQAATILEKSAPAVAAPHNNGERLPSSDAADPGADTQCSAATVDVLYAAIYKANGCTLNDGEAVRAAISNAIASVQPQPPRETELLESAGNSIGALLQWTSNWAVPFEGEDEWLGDKDVALRVRDQIASLLTRPQSRGGE